VWGGAEEILDKTLRRARVSVEHLPDTNEERYRCAILLDNFRKVRTSSFYTPL
jgi:hypothetical protein